MAGKRPDQYAIAPGEAGASDYKNLPETAKGRGGMDDTTTEDKQRVASGVGHGGGAGQHFFDPDHPQPSHDSGVHAREGHRHAGEASGMQGDSPRERGGEGTEDRGMAGDSPQRGGEGTKDREMAGDSPREREAEGTEDPRERGVGA